MRTRFQLVVLAVCCAALTCAAQEPPKRIRVGGSVMQAQLISPVAPVYPQLAKQARIQGTVRLTATISREGTVQQLEVVSGHPLLQRSALQAVSQWRYQPTLLNGQPVEVVTTIDVVYTLDGEPGAAAVPAMSPEVEIPRLREEVSKAPDDSALHQKLAMALMRNRETDAAIAAWRESLRLNPEENRSRVMLAQTLLREKFDYPGAVAEFRQALQRQPDDLGVCGMLASAHEFVYDFGQAVLQYSECIRMHPADLNTYRLAATALYRKESVPRATSEFRKIAALHANPVEAHRAAAEGLNTTNLLGAIAQVREALRIHPEDEAEKAALLRMEAMLAEQQQRIVNLRQYVAQHPGDPLGFQALAFLLHASVADHAAAWEAIRQGFQASLETDVLRLTEEAVDARGFDGAIAEGRSLARSYPESGSIQLALAGLLLKKGLTLEALQASREAVRLGPENRNAHTQLARALALTGDAEAARQESVAAAALPGSSPRPQISPDLANVLGRGPTASGENPVAAANEAAAVGALRTLNTALVTYMATYNRGYATSLAALGPGSPPSPQAADLIDASIANGTRNGYVFTLSPGPPDEQGAVRTYSLTASPIEPGKSGRQFFFTNDSGVIRSSRTGPANASSPPLN